MLDCRRLSSHFFVVDFFALRELRIGEWRKQKKVLHEKRKRRRHFNFITVLCAVYFLDKNAMECLRVDDDILSRGCTENGLFVVLHLNCTTYRSTVYDKSLA